MTDGNLVGHFLDLDFLEGSEPRRTGLHVQSASDVVGLALLRRACRERREGLLGNLLEDFVSARITRVRIDEEEGFDFGDARDDSPDSDEFTEVRTPHGADSEDVVSARRLEVDVAGRSAVGPRFALEQVSSLSPHELRGKNVWVGIVAVLQLLIKRLPAVHDDVEHVGRVVNLVIRLGHDLVDDLGEQLDVPTGVAHDVVQQTRLVRVLGGQLGEFPARTALTHLLQVVQVDRDRGRAPVGDPPQHFHVLGFTPPGRMLIIPIHIHVQVVHAICQILILVFLSFVVVVSGQSTIAPGRVGHETRQEVFDFRQLLRVVDLREGVSSVELGYARPMSSPV